jgi:hypothetical protein
MAPRGSERRSRTLLVLGLLLGGCAVGGTFKMKEVPYVAPSPPGSGETLIYVIREESPFGAARLLAIIDNDTVVAVLRPGTFSHFTVPTGQHEIVGYLSPSPVMHFRVTPSHGQTVYLFCRMGYASGLFMEPLDAARAQPLISQFKYTEIEVKGQKARMDYKAYYDNLFR